MSTLLLIDDDDEVLSINCKYLSGEGYSVYTASNPTDGLKLIRQISPDCIILDIMMPQADGYQVCKKIRTFSDIPIIFLTGKSSEDDKINGLLTGADDYMVKPFGVLELSARIRSLLRRAKREEKKDTLTFEDIVVNKKTREVTSEGHLCELTLKEFELLVYLMENQSRVVTRDELLNQVWGYEFDGETRPLDMHIRTLRQKLGDKESSCIKTVRGVGYRLVHQEG